MMSRSFTKKEVEKKLTEDEKKVFHNFIQKTRKLGIIEIDKEAGMGSYRFINEIYPIYIRMESERARKRK